MEGNSSSFVKNPDIPQNRSNWVREDVIFLKKSYCGSK